MPDEQEAKLRVADHDDVLRRLRDASAELIEDVRITDVYFDAEDARLRESDRGLRLRVREPVDGGERRARLTYKGPRRTGRNVKVRPEIETDVADADAVERILSAVGLPPAMRIEKRRTSYRLDDCRVELDELPLLGTFVEVEGADEAAIDAVCERLGLTGERIMEAYTHLLCEHCRRHGLDGREITFPREPE